MQLISKLVTFNFQVVIQWINLLFILDTKWIAAVYEVTILYTE